MINKTGLGLVTSAGPGKLWWLDNDLYWGLSIPAFMSVCWYRSVSNQNVEPIALVLQMYVKIVTKMWMVLTYLYTYRDQAPSRF